MDINNQNLLKNIGEAVEDRISELPDSILHYILSFLDIKHVARTCILSKRWKHIWTSIPTLDLQCWETFEPPSLSEINKFMDFVDRTIHLHYASNIQKFKLNLYNDMNATRVHSWIENLTSRNVEELSLNLDFHQDIPLCIPVSLFTCESLTKLELSDGPSVQFPKNILLPKLKSLKLSEIQFGGNNCWNEQPFSNCLVLENLVLENCTWFGMKKFYILTPVLKVLDISKPYDAEGGLEDCDLKIHAPILVSLTWWGCLAKDYDMCSFLSLDNAEVWFFIFDDESGNVEQRICQAVSKYLRAVSHARCLSLYVDIEQALSVADDILSSLPTFHNLNQLELCNRALIKDKRIFALLKSTPNLKHLILAEFDNSTWDDEKEYNETEDLFRHLQLVQFKEFSGKARELRWAKLILKNAKCLQRMTICCTANCNAKKKQVVISEFTSLPKASGRCVAEFVEDL